MKLVVKRIKELVYNLKRIDLVGKIPDSMVESGPGNWHL